MSSGRDAAVGGRSAGFGRRFAALLYDALLLAASLLLFTTAIVMLVARSAVLPETAGAWVYLYRAALLAIVIFYYLLNWMRSGQTLGMRAWRLRAVALSGQRMPWRSALLRLPCSACAWAPFALGILWLYIDSERAALSDRLSRTRVVELSRS